MLTGRIMMTRTSRTPGISIRNDTWPIRVSMMRLRRGERRIMLLELGVGCKFINPSLVMIPQLTPNLIRCVGSHLANRELYTAFLRCIIAFEILPPQKASDQPILDCFGCNQMPNGLTMDCKPFKVGLRVRDRAMVDKWISESEERTRDV